MLPHFEINIFSMSSTSQRLRKEGSPASKSDWHEITISCLDEANLRQLNFLSTRTSKATNMYITVCTNRSVSTTSRWETLRSLSSISPRLSEMPRYPREKIRKEMGLKKIREGGKQPTYAGSSISCGLGKTDSPEKDDIAAGSTRGGCWIWDPKKWEVIADGAASVCISSRAERGREAETVSIILLSFLYFSLSPFVTRKHPCRNSQGWQIQA